MGSLAGRQPRSTRCVRHRARRLARVVSLAVVVSGSAAGAQAVTSEVQPEFRTDVIVGPATTTEVAGGVSFPAGEYLQLGGDVGVGAVTGDGQGVRLGSRVDGLGRFQLVPETTRWGPYLAGGVSYQADVDRRGALYLLAAIGVHAPAVRGVVPGIEVGVGGGVRAGLTFRYAKRRK